MRSRLAWLVGLMASMVLAASSLGALGGCPCSEVETPALPIAGFTLSEGGEIFEGFAAYDVDRVSDDVDMGGIHLFNFRSDAPEAMVAFLVERFTGGNVGIHGLPANEVDVNGVLWHRLDHGLPEDMHEWYRYNEALHAVIQYMQPISRVSDEEAKAFLATFDERNSRFVPVLADFTPVPDYVFAEGGELFESFTAYDVDRDSDGLDLGGIHVFAFRKNAPVGMKAFIIDRFTSSNVGVHGETAVEIDVRGITWHRLRHEMMDEWYRYDEARDAVLQYMQPLARVSDDDAIEFLDAFNRSASGEGSFMPSGELAERTEPDYLFVASAQSGSFANGTLTLKRIPFVVYFSDRPDRDTGHISVERLVNSWSDGADSFESDPPNATLSIFDPSGGRNIVVELMHPFVVDGDLTFEVEVLQGELPPSFGPCSLFIDNFSLPSGIGQTWQLLVSAAGFWKGSTVNVTFRGQTVNLVTDGGSGSHLFQGTGDKPSDGLTIYERQPLGSTGFGESTNAIPADQITWQQPDGINWYGEWSTAVTGD